MRKLSLSCMLLSISVCFFSSQIVQAQGLTKKQAARFDANGDKFVDAGKEVAFPRHLALGFLATYDANLNGQIDPDEVQKMNEDARKVDFSPESADTRLRVKQGVPVPVTTTYEKVVVIPRTDIRQQFYLREKRSDIGVGGDSLKALGGASFSYADDIANNNSSVTVKGAAGVLFRNSRVGFKEGYKPGDLAVTGYAFGPFVEGNGTINTKQTRLTAGIIGQVEVFSGPFFDLQMLGASPYYQTDFDGDASIYGGVVSWQPFNSDLALGTYRQLPGGSDFTWLLEGEADYKFIDKSGSTKYSVNSDNLWVGLNGTARLLPFVEQSEGRFYLEGNYALYYDLVSGEDAALGRAKIGYYFGADKNAAIEFVYSNGKDHDTLLFDESIKAALTLRH